MDALYWLRYKWWWLRYGRHQEEVVEVAETSLISCKPKMVVTVRFNNTHVVEGIFMGWDADKGQVRIDRAEDGEPRYFKADMIERIFRDAAVTRRVNKARQ